VYVLRVSLNTGGSAARAATAGLAVSYSPEYRFLGTDGGTLAAIAQAGGGSVLTDARSILAAVPPPVDAVDELTSALLVLSLGLLVADVAARRLRVRHGDLTVWRQALAGDDRRGEAAGAAVGALRERVAARRSDANAREELSARLLDARRRRR
jgi:hypothetical protein